MEIAQPWGASQSCQRGLKAILMTKGREPMVSPLK